MELTDPVPVFREKPQRIVETFRKSMQFLTDGENLLVFPENPYDEPFSNEVNTFYDGFLYIAKLYYKKTKKSLLFCPVSINPKKEQLAIGKTIRYNPMADYDGEVTRMKTHLMGQVAGLYHQPWIPVEGEVKPDIVIDYQPGLT